MKKKYFIWITLLSLFLLIMILVILGKTTSIDNYIYNLIASDITDTKTQIFKIITFLGSTKFIVTLCAIFLLLFLVLKNKWVGINICMALITSTLFNNIVKIIIRRPRPLVTKLVIEHSYSFPSGHTMAATMMYGILIYYVLNSKLNKYFKVILSIFLGILIILIGISRIYLGAHFFTDVIAGIILSLLLLLIFIDIIKNKKKDFKI